MLAEFGLFVLLMSKYLLVNLKPLYYGRTHSATIILFFYQINIYAYRGDLFSNRLPYVWNDILINKEVDMYVTKKGFIGVAAIVFSLWGFVQAFTEIEKPIVVSHAAIAFKGVLYDGQSFATECLEEHQLSEQIEQLVDIHYVLAPANIGIEICLRTAPVIPLSHTELIVENRIRGAAKLQYSLEKKVFIEGKTKHETCTDLIVRFRGMCPVLFDSAYGGYWLKELG